MRIVDNYSQGMSETDRAVRALEQTHVTFSEARIDATRRCAQPRGGSHFAPDSDRG